MNSMFLKKELELSDILLQIICYFGLQKKFEDCIVICNTISGMIQDFRDYSPRT